MLLYRYNFMVCNYLEGTISKLSLISFVKLVIIVVVLKAMNDMFYVSFTY